MKTIFGMFVAAAMIAVAAPVAMAQTSTSTCTGCTTSTPSKPTVGVTVDVGTYSAGKYQADWDGDEGSAEATEQGGAYAIFDYTYDSCDSGDCGPTRLAIQAGSYKLGETTAMSRSTTPGKPAVVGNMSVAQIGGYVAVTPAPPMPASD